MQTQNLIQLPKTPQSFVVESYKNYGPPGFIIINGKEAAILQRHGRLVCQMVDQRIVVKIDYQSFVSTKRNLSSCDDSLYMQTRFELEFWNQKPPYYKRKYFPKLLGCGVVKDPNHPNEFNYWLAEEYVDLYCYGPNPKIYKNAQKVVGRFKEKFPIIAKDMNNYNWSINKRNNKLVIYDWGYLDPFLHKEESKEEKVYA